MVQKITWSSITCYCCLIFYKRASIHACHHRGIADNITRVGNPGKNIAHCLSMTIKRNPHVRPAQGVGA